MQWTFSILGSATLIPLTIITTRNIKFAEVPAHMWPIIRVSQHSVRFIGTKMSTGVVCQVEKVFTQGEVVRNYQATRNKPQAVFMSNIRN
ncbi:hypothetical protein F5051DRAFT_414322 [Lentinula edodes]|nr:hypothetical protein F5051DRAFT_414322 [Lentinula edodes]